MEYVLTFAVVVAVLAATYRLMNAWSRRRVMSDFRDPDEVLSAARIYEKYDRHDAAREILEAGVARHPEHDGLQQALDRLRARGD